MVAQRGKYIKCHWIIDSLKWWISCPVNFSSIKKIILHFEKKRAAEELWKNILGTIFHSFVHSTFFYTLSKGQDTFWLEN